MNRLKVTITLSACLCGTTWANDRINFESLRSLSPPPHPKSVHELSDLPSVARDKLQEFRELESGRRASASASVERERAIQSSASHRIDRISADSRQLRCVGGRFDGKTVTFYINTKFGYHTLGLLGGVSKIDDINEWIKRECDLR